MLPNSRISEVLILLILCYNKTKVNFKTQSHLVVVGFFLWLKAKLGKVLPTKTQLFPTFS
jgi:hypothetical protein